MTSSSLFKEQLRRNTVALISLAVAVTSLGYNTWRNEASEHNRNQRLVSIELLLTLGDLQQLTLDLSYGDDEDRAAIRRKAWAKVLFIRDLALICEGSVPSSAAALLDTWNSEFKRLSEEADAREKIVTALEAVRRDAHDVLRSLD